MLTIHFCPLTTECALGSWFEVQWSWTRHGLQSRCKGIPDGHGWSRKAGGLPLKMMLKQTDVMPSTVINILGSKRLISQITPLALNIAVTNMKLPWLTPALQPVPNLPGTRFSAWPQASAPFSCPGLPTAKSSIPWRHRSVKGDNWAHQKNWLVGGWTNSCEKYYIVVVKCSICPNKVEATKYIKIFEKHSIYSTLYGGVFTLPVLTTTGSSDGTVQHWHDCGLVWLVMTDTSQLIIPEHKLVI